MSDCEHAAHIFEKFYLMDEFVSGKACPYCRNAELESDLEYACESIRALEETVGFFEDKNERLEAENKALRDAIKQHRKEVTATCSDGAPDIRLWNTLKQEQGGEG